MPEAPSFLKADHSTFAGKVDELHSGSEPGSFNEFVFCDPAGFGTGRASQDGHFKGLKMSNQIWGNVTSGSPKIIRKAFFGKEYGVVQQKNRHILALFLGHSGQVQAPCRPVGVIQATGNHNENLLQHATPPYVNEKPEKTGTQASPRTCMIF
jgi:hypothetical protein